MGWITTISETDVRGANRERDGLSWSPESLFTLLSSSGNIFIRQTCWSSSVVHERASCFKHPHICCLCVVFYSLSILLTAFFLHFSCALTEGCADHLESSQVLIMTGFSTDWFLTLSLIILPFLPIQYLTVSLVLWPSFCGLLPHTMLRGSTPRHFNNTHINNRF